MTDITIWRNANIATMSSGLSNDSLIYDGALVTKGETIVWTGPVTDIPAEFTHSETIDCQGDWLLPGFIDCHTHLVFAGNRAAEFEMRLQGKSYEEIAKAGGGILNTVKATREASAETLLTLAIQRAKAMLGNGVTTIEVKSGYGLDCASELKMLSVAKQLADHLPIDVKTTFLGAHAIPPEYKNNGDAYVELVCNDMLPQVAKAQLADAVDVFCESIGFDLAQTRKVLQTAKDLGIPVKAHVEQLSNLGGSELAASLNALSVDHIEFLDEQGIAAIARSGTIATLLPGAFYFLRETQKPPVALLRQYNIPMAVATDFNPGSSPIASLPLMLNMACTFFGLTPEEALLGVTKHAAKALGMGEVIGQLAPGFQADMVRWPIGHPRELCYEFGVQSPTALYKKSKKVSI
ncbi:MAG: imidazolonepropionase [Aestuariibacter sp.]